MKLPTKVTSYQESVISKFVVILEILNEKDVSLSELYSYTKQYFHDATEFIDAIDCLFALNKLEYNDDLEVLHYAIWNLLREISSKESYFW